MKRLVACAVVLVLATAACKREKKPTADTLELKETYRVKSGLAVLHHPKVLVPAQVDDHVASLTPASIGLFDIGDEIYVLTTKTPVTSDLEEYVRIAHEPLEADMKSWTVTSRRAASCLGVYAGIELEATFLGKDGRKRRYWSCTFLRAPNGFKVSYVVNEEAAAKDAPLLRKVVDATELAIGP